MVVLERLNNNNADIFDSLLQDSKKVIKYQQDFYRYYMHRGSVHRFFIKKAIRLLKYKDDYIGYIWLDTIGGKSQRINDIYIVPEHLELVNPTTMNLLKSNVLIYEGYENEYIIYLAKRLDMKLFKATRLMKINNKVLRNDEDYNISYKVYDKITDRKIRCYIQNEVFSNKDRVPLTVSDIEFDEGQEYYIQDYCIFIKYNNAIIGYGQIVFNRGQYFIVNLGIIKSYRGFGYGKLLLNRLLNLANKDGIKDVYIRVENDNKLAAKLYEETGFEDVGKISNWVWHRI